MENVFNTFLHRISIYHKYFDCTMNIECVGGTWWSPRKYWWLLVISKKLAHSALPQNALESTFFQSLALFRISGMSRLPKKIFPAASGKVAKNNTIADGGVAPRCSFAGPT